MLNPGQRTPPLPRMIITHIYIYIQAALWKCYGMSTVYIQYIKYNCTWFHSLTWSCGTRVVREMAMICIIHILKYQQILTIFPQSVKKGLVVCLLSPMQSDVSMRSMNSSGRSRGGSTALSKGCLQKYYAQTYYTYTMATLELHGRARTCACQLKVISCIKNLTCAHHLCACICKQLY